jgi:hypothetical protein
MANRLSNSQLNRYQTCPKSFELYYKQNLKGDRLTSALLFGTAFDKAVEMLMHSQDLEAAKQVFLDTWTTQEIDGVPVLLKHNKDISYFKSDLDVELIYDKININEESDAVLNWESMLQKGYIMLMSTYANILPRIKKIHSTQELVSLKNQDEDEIIGYVDLVADIDDSTVILDFKTSASAYDDDSVKHSQQLILYTHILQEKYKTRKAGFLVVSKKIKVTVNKKCSVCGESSSSSHKTCNAVVNDKRCNGQWIVVKTFEAPTQVIISEIPSIAEDIIIDNVASINDAIKKNVFPRNFSSCFDTYGKPCEFANLCWKGSMEGIKSFERKVKNV